VYTERERDRERVRHTGKSKMGADGWGRNDNREREREGEREGGREQRNRQSDTQKNHDTNRDEQAVEVEIRTERKRERERGRDIHTERKRHREITKQNRNAQIAGQEIRQFCLWRNTLKIREPIYCTCFFQNQNTISKLKIRILPQK